MEKTPSAPQTPIDLLCPYLITGQEILQAWTYLRDLLESGASPEDAAAWTIARTFMQQVTELHIETSGADASDAQAVLRVMVPRDFPEEIIQYAQGALCVQSAPETLSVEALAARKLLSLVYKSWDFELGDAPDGPAPSGLEEEELALIYQDIPIDWIETYMLYCLGRYAYYDAQQLAELASEHFGVVLPDRQPPSVFSVIADDALAHQAAMRPKKDEDDL